MLRQALERRKAEVDREEPPLKAKRSHEKPPLEGQIEVLDYDDEELEGAFFDGMKWNDYGKNVYDITKHASLG